MKWSADSAELLVWNNWGQQRVLDWQILNVQKMTDANRWIKTFANSSLPHNRSNWGKVGCEQLPLLLTNVTWKFLPHVAQLLPLQPESTLLDSTNTFTPLLFGYSTTSHIVAVANYLASHVKKNLPMTGRWRKQMRNAEISRWNSDRTTEMNDETGIMK